jgi:hypothetical protein
MGTISCFLAFFVSLTNQYVRITYIPVTNTKTSEEETVIEVTLIEELITNPIITPSVKRIRLDIIDATEIRLDILWPMLSRSLLQPMAEPDKVLPQEMYVKPANQYRQPVGGCVRGLVQIHFQRGICSWIRPMK